MRDRIGSYPATAALPFRFEGNAYHSRCPPCMYPSRMALPLIETPRVGPEWGPFDDGCITGDSGFDTQSTDEWSSGPSSVDGQWPPPEEGPEPPSPVLLFPVECRLNVFVFVFRFWRMVMRHGVAARLSRAEWFVWLGRGEN